MNCKPGDLVVIVRISPSLSWAIGRVVRVLEPVGRAREIGSPYVLSSDGWALEEILRSPTGEEFDCIADSCLKPIRDHGDDAIDESKAWLPPVPLPTIDPSLLPTKETA